jgi:L-methionine (R)-S-oxide reductase
MRALSAEETNWVSNLANASSLLWHMYHSLTPPSSSVNWAGFYVLDARDHDRLILGPFHGKVACQSIEIGKGVCGMAAGEGKTLLLEDVREFPQHIACDADSKSEIVVPIMVGDEVSDPLPNNGARKYLLS